MPALLLSDLKLALDDLFTKRKVALHASLAGKLYAPQLEAVHGRIVALPPALYRAVPLVDALRTLDRDHDGFGAAIRHFVEAYLRAPTTPAALQKSAIRIRDFLVPELAQLQADFATEAERAKGRKSKLNEYSKELKAFPLAPKGTLLDWANGYVENGIALDAALSDRAAINAKSKSAPGAAGGLRGEALGLLTRFRAALRDEINATPKLKGLEGKVFGYLDELSARRPSAVRAKSTKKGAPTTAPAAGATGGDTKVTEAETDTAKKAKKKAKRRARR